MPGRAVHRPKPAKQRGAGASTAVIAGHEVEVVRKRVKRLSLRVYPPDGRVRLTVPLGVEARELERAVAERSAWIEGHQRRIRRWSGEAARYLPGEVHYLRGRPYQLMRPAYAPAQGAQAPSISAGKGWRGVGVELAADGLVLHAAVGAGHDEIERAFAAFYRTELKADAAPMMATWEARLGVQASALRIRRMATRWGSCNTRAGRVWLNLELAKRRPELLECVVVHELVHLLVPDHGPRFKAIMTSALPDWRARARELETWPLWARLPAGA